MLAVPMVSLLFAIAVPDTPRQIAAARDRATVMMLRMDIARSL